MKHRIQAPATSPGDQQRLTTGDGALSFVVRRVGRCVHVERNAPLGGIGEVSQIMRFDTVESFLAACEADDKRFVYPLVFWQLRHAVEALLFHER